MSLLPDATLNGTFGLILVFVACELGHRITDAFDRIDFTIDQLDWYLFPIEVKRVLPMIIVSAQQPVSVGCFGSIVCIRDVFKNVSIDRKSFRYYVDINQCVNVANYIYM